VPQWGCRSTISTMKSWLIHDCKARTEQTRKGVSEMSWKGIVGARFSPNEFTDYVGHLTFSAWRPQFVVVHNTSSPTLAQRPNGFTDAHIQNLVAFYRDQQHWSAGPHCFIDQNGISVFTPLTVPGVHSPSWNSISWVSKPWEST
jgi:hypothetical protein